ncbi:MAG: riboflavin biosynthesis protein RibF [Phycisphaeraceae bacterium]
MASRPSILTIGNFDGVHLGHRAILSASRRLAEHASARVTAVTFDPFPVAILRPEATPPQVMSIDQRIEALRDAGADDVVVLKPSPELLGSEASAFIEDLIDQHAAVGFVEGEDFRFGKRRGGDMALLEEMGRSRGFAVQALPRVETPLSDQTVAPISSSLVRWLVGRGRVEDAEACLGRTFELVGTIVKGEQRGRTLGIPTANLDPQAYASLITPMDGVYAGTVTLDPAQGPLPAAISVGVKPTFDHDRLTIEAHLIDYQMEHPDGLYGKPARFGFARWVRDQYPFPGVPELKEQLERDIATARTLVANDL